MITLITLQCQLLIYGFMLIDVIFKWVDFKDYSHSVQDKIVNICSLSHVNIKSGWTELLVRSPALVITQCLDDLIFIWVLFYL